MKQLKLCIKNNEFAKKGKRKMTIYEELLDSVKNGSRFKIDLKNKSMKVGNKWLIKNGEWDLNKDLIGFKCDPVGNMRNDWCLAQIGLLYQDYKYSYPSEKSEKNKEKRYFYALPDYKMTDEELVAGQDREYARAALEGFLLCAVLEEWLVWNEHTMGKWFYQGKDKDLIILKEWVNN